nr:ribonuclease P protein subunit p25-like protein [Tanacetum cinerariifolium]
RILCLHQITSIVSTDITDTWEPLEEGLLPLETTRHVSLITITLSKELDTSSIGTMRCFIFLSKVKIGYHALNKASIFRVYREQLIKSIPVNVDDFEPMSSYEPPYSSSGPTGDNYPVEEVPPSKKKSSKGRQRKPSKKLVVEEVNNIQWTTDEKSPLYQGWVCSSADSSKGNSKKAKDFGQRY